MNVAVEAFDHIVINVRDVEASAAWYERVLGMTRIVTEPRPGRPVTSMHFGRQKINLRPIKATQEQWFTGKAVAPGSDDLCFLTKSTPQQVVAHLTNCGVAIEEGPGEKSGAQGTLISVYCRDPDGSLIEISSYK
jgi:catechol 2,3-dioxygenase-like lactoylglutathione lyase family enzyme